MNDTVEFDEFTNFMVSLLYVKLNLYNKSYMSLSYTLICPVPNMMRKVFKMESKIQNEWIEIETFIVFFLFENIAIWTKVQWLLKINTYFQVDSVESTVYLTWILQTGNTPTSRIQFFSGLVLLVSAALDTYRLVHMRGCKKRQQT